MSGKGESFSRTSFHVGARKSAHEVEWMQAQSADEGTDKAADSDAA